MTAQKILETAMLKAHKNGWRPLTTIDWNNVEITQWQGRGMVGIAFLYGTKDLSAHWVRELEGIIFNHDFARALWGTELNDTAIESEHWASNWKYHLQRMVIAEDPIKYLGEHL